MLTRIQILLHYVSPTACVYSNIKYSIFNRKKLTSEPSKFSLFATQMSNFFYIIVRTTTHNRRYLCTTYCFPSHFILWIQRPPNSLFKIYDLIESIHCLLSFLSKFQAEADYKKVYFEQGSSGFFHPSNPLIAFANSATVFSAQISHENSAARFFAFSDMAFR